MLVEEYRNLSEILSRELQKIKGMDNVVIIGGWAAHFLSNKRFREWKAVDYIGSKDIDIGVKNSDLEKTKKKLTALGFIPMNFRFYKVFDRETKKEISETKSKKRPLYNNFYLYLDIILDRQPKEKTTFFHDEIIGLVLENRLWTEKQGFRIIRPEPLLLTKLRVLENRNKEKRVKDVLDCLFVSNFSNMDKEFFEQLKAKFVIGRKNKRIAEDLLMSREIDIELLALRFDENESRAMKTSLLSLIK